MAEETPGERGRAAERPAPTVPTGPPAVPRTVRVPLPPEVAGLVGRTWAGYEIVLELGRGGMAVVYKAYQRRLDRFVAVKLLLPQAGVDASLLQRFEREARVAAGLRHPNIVAVYDYGEEQGIPYLVMEYVEGETLASGLGEVVVFDRALRIVGQVAEALDHAHEKGVIHRDVKPSNVLLARRDWALLSDFGIARALESGPRLTGTGVAIGTPEYMSPEQCRGDEVDGRSDVYSLGVVLYEMLTGRAPFTADTPLSVMLKQVNDPLPAPRSLNPMLPEAVERVMVKALAKDRNYRHATAGGMVAELAGAGGGAAQARPVPPEARPAPRPKPVPRPAEVSTRFPRAVALAALVSAAGIALNSLAADPSDFGWFLIAVLVLAASVVAASLRAARRLPSLLARAAGIVGALTAGISTFLLAAIPSISSPDFGGATSAEDFEALLQLFRRTVSFRATGLGLMGLWLVLVGVAGGARLPSRGLRWPAVVAGAGWVLAAPAWFSGGFPFAVFMDRLASLAYLVWAGWLAIALLPRARRTRSREVGAGPTG